MTPREIVLKLCERCSGYLTLGLIQECVAEAVAAERERCAKIAQHATLKPYSLEIHPDIPFDKASETSRMIAHTTAQSIAAAIRD